MQDDNPLGAVLGYHGRPARLQLAVTVGGRAVYTFAGDLASAHFAGEHGTAVRYLRRHLWRVLRESSWDSVERLGVQCHANGLFVARRECHVFPRMTDPQREDFVEALCYWLSQWLASGALPIGEAMPLYLREGRIVG